MDNKTLYAAQAARFCNQPLLINPACLPALSRALAMQAPVDLAAKMAAFELVQAAGPQLEVANGVALIRVNGILSYHTDIWSWLEGGTSYDDIRTQFRAARADPTAKNIVMLISSGGGEASGLFDLVDEIYQARGPKPIYAVFDEDGFSAAFALASAADKRYISRTGKAGSVGVVAMHIDQSGWDAQMGLAFTYIFAGSHKVDYSPHAPLSPEAMASVQENIDTAYDIFVNTVARNLGLTAAAVKASEANIYQGKQAVDIGFADSVMSFNQFMAKLTNRKYGGIMKAELEQLFNDMRDKFFGLLVSADPAAVKQEVVTKADAAALVAAAETAAQQEGHVAGHIAGLAEGRETGRQEAQTRATEILEVCALAALEKDALGYVKDTALSVENVRAKVVEAQAAAADATKIRSTVSATSTGEVDPLLADARKRAAAAAGISVVK
jgi:ClpP class serine protease